MFTKFFRRQHGVPVFTREKPNEDPFRPTLQSVEAQSVSISRNRTIASKVDLSVDRRRNVREIRNPTVSGGPKVGPTRGFRGGLEIEWQIRPDLCAGTVERRPRSATSAPAPIRLRPGDEALMGISMRA